MLTSQGWRRLSILAALVVVAGYLVVALQRVAYPYDLEFIEDGMLMQALRMAHGLPTYLPPNAEFVPHAYPPLYPWLGSWLLRLTGPLFWPLRALSLAATLASARLVYAISRRESGATLVAAAGAALFLAGNRLVGGWYELARVDALFVTLVLAGMALAAYRQNTLGGLIGAALLLTASLYTKQQGLFFLTIAGIYLVWARRRQAWPYFAAAALAGIPVFLYLQATTGGGFAFYTFGIQGGSSELQAMRALLTLGLDFGGGMGVLVFAFLFACVFAARRLGRRFFLVQPWFLFTAAAVAVAVLGRTSVGGNLNHLMPAYALLCLAPALLWAEVAPWPEQRRKPAAWLLGTALMLQLGLTFFNPVRALTSATLPLRLTPTAAMRQAGDRLVARLAAVDGDVLVPQLPFYVVLAAKTPSVQISALWHARHRGRDPLPADLAARLQSRQYALIVSDDSDYFETDPAWMALLTTYYRPAGMLDSTEAPPTLSGVVVRPRTLYVPR